MIDILSSLKHHLTAVNPCNEARCVLCSQWTVSGRSGRSGPVVTSGVVEDWWGGTGPARTLRTKTVGETVRGWADKHTRVTRRPAARTQTHRAVSDATLQRSSFWHSESVCRLLCVVYWDCLLQAAPEEWSWWRRRIVGWRTPPVSRDLLWPSFWEELHLKLHYRYHHLPFPFHLLIEYN